jgi:hypothetical protein
MGRPATAFAEAFIQTLVHRLGLHTYIFWNACRKPICNVQNESQILGATKPRSGHAMFTILHCNRTDVLAFVWTSFWTRQPGVGDVYCDIDVASFFFGLSYWWAPFDRWVQCRERTSPSMRWVSYFIDVCVYGM